MANIRAVARSRDVVLPIEGPKGGYSTTGERSPGGGDGEFSDRGRRMGAVAAAGADRARARITDTEGARRLCGRDSEDIGRGPDDTLVPPVALETEETVGRGAGATGRDLEVADLQ